MLEIKLKQKGLALVTTAIIGVIFLVITTGALYLTIINSEKTLEQKTKTKLNASVYSGLEVALGKIQRYFYDSALNKYKPTIHFHNSKQKRESLINGTVSLNSLQTVLSNATNSTYNLLNLPVNIVSTSGDDLNIGYFRRLPGENYFAPANFYKTEIIGDKNQPVTVLYSINGDNSVWVQNSNNPSESTFTYQVESLTKDNASGKWQGAIADVEVTRFSLSGYGIFYADDLEILPGPDMIFNGRVHSNNNIFLGTGNTLTFNSTLSSAKHIFRGRKDTNDTNTGTVRVKNPITNEYVNLTSSNDSINTLSGFSNHHLSDPKLGDGINNPPSNPNDTWQIDPNWENNAKSLWGEAVKDKVHGVKEMPKPDIKSIDRGGFYEENAGLKIITKTQGTEGTPGVANSFNNYKEIVEVTDKNGNLVYKKTINYNNSGGIASTNYDYISGDMKMTTGNTTCTSSALCNTLVNTSNDPISTLWFMNGREVDNRAGKPVRTTNIDVAKIQNTNLWPNDGLVYSSREDAVPDSDMLDGINNTQAPDANRKPYGIMLQNGATLSKPINFVTNNPVYIRGDFNLHKSASGTRFINETTNAEHADFGKPNIDTWKPASIISDALNILSKSWIPTNYQNTSTPSPNNNASHTEVNATMVTGIVATDKSSSYSSYSGGFENYPRFLENWTGTGREFVMRGSFIQLWQSKFATGRQTQNTNRQAFYAAPKRSWGFDRSYEIQNENLPAGFLDVVPATTESVKIKNIKLVRLEDTTIYKDLSKIKKFNTTSLINNLSENFGININEIVKTQNN